MDKDKIKDLVLNEGLTITDLIDVVIELNGFIGVGLIRLGDDLKQYLYNMMIKFTVQGISVINFNIKQTNLAFSSIN